MVFTIQLHKGVYATVDIKVVDRQLMEFYKCATKKWLILILLLTIQTKHKQNSLLSHLLTKIQKHFLDYPQCPGFSQEFSYSLLSLSQQYVQQEKGENIKKRSKIKRIATILVIVIDIIKIQKNLIVVTGEVFRVELYLIKIFLFTVHNFNFIAQLPAQKFQI